MSLLTSGWVHCGESQDASVVGIEGIRWTPWSKVTIKEKFGWLGIYNLEARRKVYESKEKMLGDQANEAL